MAGNGTAASVDGDAETGSLNTPFGVAVDAAGSIIYVSEYAGHRIRKVVPPGKTVASI